MPFGRKRVSGVRVGKRRNIAQLQLARERKTARGEFVVEPAVTMSSLTTMPATTSTVGRGVSLISDVL